MGFEHDIPPAEWDAALAGLGGHPLQSALWSEARRAEEGLKSRYWAYRNGQGKIVWMARIEERAMTPIHKLGWIPRGPTFAPDCGISDADFHRELKAANFFMAVTDLWKDANRQAAEPGIADHRPRTIWIDLGVGADKLWSNLKGSRRTGVKRAEKSGVVVEQAVDDRTIEAFHRMCLQISALKSFKFDASASLIRRLIRAEPKGGVTAHLFVARHEGGLCAGALILRCGRSIHYMWAGTDRAYSALCPGEALQWAIMQWAVSAGCTRYDLEGIDEAANPGTYAFKKSLGGSEVVLAGQQVLPISMMGQMLSPLVERRLRAG